MSHLSPSVLAGRCQAGALRPTVRRGRSGPSDHGRWCFARSPSPATLPQSRRSPAVRASTAANSRRVRSFSPRPTAANRSQIADGSIIRRVYPDRVRAGIHRGEITGYPTRANSLIVGRRLRLARVLRLLPDPPRAHEFGSVDPPTTTDVSLAAVVEWTKSLQRTPPPRRPQVPRSGRRRLADGILAYVRTPGGPTGPAEPRLRLPRSAPALCHRPSITQSNRRGTDPYARWCGSCALEARKIQSPEMVTSAKPNQQP